MIRRRTLALLATLAMVFTGLGFVATPAQAGTGLYYHAVDSDRDTYDGIYLRNGTSMASVTKVTSRYMLYGTTVELICGTDGESVGPYNNRRWHQVYVPSGYAAGQTGWIADRYLDTPNKANEKTPNEPECGSSGGGGVVVTPKPNVRGAMYFSPFEADKYVPAGTAMNVPLSQWAYGQSFSYEARYYMNTKLGLGSVPTPNCNMGKVNGLPLFNPDSARSVTSLSGWSAGRVGAIAKLQTAGNSIDYVMLIDPGSFLELTVYGCDKQIGAGNILYTWLKNHPQAHLAILAGSVTRDDPSANGRYKHRGIQEAYFGSIRKDPGVAARVVVCNYDYDHSTMFTRYSKYADQAPITKGNCPDGAYGWNP